MSSTSAVLINRPPEIENLAIDFDHSFINVPLVTRLWSIATNRIGIQRTELSFPIAYRLVTGFNPTIGQQLFDIAKAQAEATTEPYRVADDLPWKTVPLKGSR